MDDRGVQVERDWSSTGELRAETLLLDAEQAFTTTAGYDHKGQLTSLAYPGSAAATVLGRDALGRLQTLTVNGAAVWSGTYHGLRLGGGVSGMLALTRSHTVEGMPAAVTASVGESERYSLRRSYDPTLRFTSEQRSTTFASSSRSRTTRASGSAAGS